VQGTHPTKDDDPVQRALDALYEIDRHIVHVNEELAKLPVSECPEGKLTEKLYRRSDLHVQLVLLEEFQCYFELDDQKRNKEFANLFARIGALGPSAGVVLLGASQKPSGVGAGDVQRLFNRFRDNFILRFALRCATRDVSMAVLGNESYGEGYDASGLPLGDEFKGIGILYGLVDDAPTVRTYLADGEDAEVICLAARKIRERAHTLSGDALGVEVAEPESDIVADLREVMAGDAGCGGRPPPSGWPPAGRCATRMRRPSRCRPQPAPGGCPSTDIRWPPGRTGTNRKGWRKADLTAAARP
jgi:S-DNA-T family DNA segregation ATPase FtsK/SpoIIIE